MDSIKNADKNATSAGAMSRVRISLYLFYGVIFPVIALSVNYWMFGGTDFDLLYGVGAVFLLPRLGYLYVTIGTGIVTLFLWLVLLRTYGKRFNGFIGGILLFSALFNSAFVIAGIYRFMIIPVWLPPLCAIPIFLLSGIRAIKIAKGVMGKRRVVLTVIVGFLFAVVLSLFIVRQPWGVMKYLPNAQGANLSGMDLSRIYLDGCSGVTFKKANLSNVDLNHAYLVHGNMDMNKVNLQGANLSHAVLSAVNLTRANFRGVNLNNAKLYQVDFTGADFRGASLGFHAGGRILMQDANLCGADLREIKTIEGVYVWEGAIYDSATLWPEGFNPAEKGAVMLADGDSIE